MQHIDFSDQKRILYVDGYEDNRLLMSYLLQQRDYDGRVASTMIDGLALAMSEHFDLFILDYWYKDGTGVELCKRIRRFDLTTPIFFFSAWTPDSAREAALRAGAIVYLFKPELGKVLREIHRLLADARPRSGFKHHLQCPPTQPTRSA